MSAQHAHIEGTRLRGCTTTHASKKGSEKGSSDSEKGSAEGFQKGS